MNRAPTEDIEEVHVNIREFPLHKMQPNSKIVVIGKPDTGKSTLLMDILYTFKHFFPVGMFMSGTEDVNHFYKKFVPDTFVYPSFRRRKVRHFIRRQLLAHKYLQVPWNVLLIDDCTDNNKIFDDILFHQIFKKGRHWNMMFILSLHYAMSVKPWLRNCIDYTFIMRETNYGSREKLWKNYGSVVPNLHLWEDLMNQLTENYTCIVIDNRVKSNRMEDCVYYYRSNPEKLQGFMFGCKEYWNWHRQRYNEDYQDRLEGVEEEEEDQ